MSRQRRRRADLHARLAQNLTHGQLQVVAEPIEDPWDGTVIVALKSTRDDPLLALKSRRQIGNAEFQAGRRWEALSEAAEIYGARAIDPMKERVDGGRLNVSPITDRHMDAFRQIVEAQKVLGWEGARLVRSVLDDRLTIIATANLRGMTRARDIDYLGARFRECLATLAGYWGMLPN